MENVYVLIIYIYQLIELVNCVRLVYVNNANKILISNAKYVNLKADYSLLMGNVSALSKDIN